MISKQISVHAVMHNTNDDVVFTNSLEIITEKQVITKIFVQNQKVKVLRLTGCRISDLAFASQRLKTSSFPRIFPLSCFVLLN